jgi:hypothetical protein
MLGIYIPREGPAAAVFRPGSAIVGAPKGSHSILVASADNRHGSRDSFADLTVIAADRYQRGMSSSRRLVEEEALRQVAYLDPIHGRVVVTDPDDLTALSDWFGQTPDLEATAIRFQLQRALSDRRLDPVTRSWINKRLERS